MSIFSNPLARFLLGMGLGMLGLCVAWTAGLRVNVTPSLPRGLYLLCPGTPGKGDYAAFCLTGEYAALAKERGYVLAGSCPSGLRPLLKRVAALPGDVLDATTITAFPLRETDNQGRALPSVLTGGPQPVCVPPGMALLLADHPGSFDGRYFGLVPLNQLQRVKPLLTTSNSKEPDSY